MRSRSTVIRGMPGGSELGRAIATLGSSKGPALWVASGADPNGNGVVYVFRGETLVATLTAPPGADGPTFGVALP